MEIVSINVGKSEYLSGRGFEGETGIFKRPVDGAVQVGPLGLESDTVVDQKNHGGPDQAVYLYRVEDYAWWSEELGRELAPGDFGENLTIIGLTTPGLAIGTRLRFSEVVLEVTAPRIPCGTFGVRMGDPEFIKAFMRAARTGIYCRVIQAGRISAGQTFTLADSNAAPVSTVDLVRARYRKLARDEIERFLAAPIDMRTRRRFEKQLEKGDS